MRIIALAPRSCGEQATIVCTLLSSNISGASTLLAEAEGGEAAVEAGYLTLGVDNATADARPRRMSPGATPSFITPSVSPRVERVLNSAPWVVTTVISW